MTRESSEIEGVSHTEETLTKLIEDHRRKEILMDIIAHPKHSPAITEFMYIYQSKDTEAVAKAIGTLEEYDIITRVTNEESMDFYAITEAGWNVVDFFDEDFTPAVFHRLNDAYTDVIEEAPPEVQTAYNAPRPEIAEIPNQTP